MAIGAKPLACDKPLHLLAEHIALPGNMSHYAATRSLCVGTYCMAGTNMPQNPPFAGMVAPGKPNPDFIAFEGQKGSQVRLPGSPELDLAVPRRDCFCSCLCLSDFSVVGLSDAARFRFGCIGS